MLTFYIQGRKITLELIQWSDFVSGSDPDPTYGRIDEETIINIERQSRSFWPSFLPGHFNVRRIEVPIPSNPTIYRRYSERGGVPYMDVRTQNMDMSQFPECFAGYKIFGINTFVPNESDTIEVRILVKKAE